MECKDDYCEGWLVASCIRRCRRRGSRIDRILGLLASLEKTRMTGLEPATSGVTGRCSNQLSYIPRTDSSHRAIFAVIGLAVLVARSVRIPCRSLLDALIVTGRGWGFNRDAKGASGNSQSTDMAPQCGFLFEEQLRLDRRSFSPRPRETAVLHGEELAKSAEMCPFCAHFFPMAQAAIEHSQSHGALVFMATEHGSGIVWDSFLVCEENGRPEKKGKRQK